MHATEACLKFICAMVEKILVFDVSMWEENMKKVILKKYYIWKKKQVYITHKAKIVGQIIQ